MDKGATLPGTFLRVNSLLMLAGTVATLVCQVILSTGCRPEEKGVTMGPTRFPTYHSDQANLGGNIPSDLQALLLEEHSLQRHNQLQDSLLESLKDIPKDSALLAIIRLGDSALLCLPGEVENPLCVPFFTSPLRAFHYAHVILGSESDQASVFFVSADRFLAILRDTIKHEIRSFTVDPGPTCDFAAAVLSSNMKSTSGIYVAWAVYSSTRILAYDIYMTRAKQLLQRGDTEQARDIGLGIIGCTDVDDPSVHLLLGECGLVLGDERLLQDADDFLRFFEPRWRDSLQRLQSLY